MLLVRSKLEAAQISLLIAGVYAFSNGSEDIQKVFQIYVWMYLIGSLFFLCDGLICGEYRKSDSPITIRINLGIAPEVIAALIIASYGYVATGVALFLSAIIYEFIDYENMECEERQ
ncbi:hypothetical protein [Nitrosomonas marina]|uniref:Uncharacterized protein n=1 Tax=Nitrosomonas marina TaxID=917 RepID=A0A1H8GJZ5_9PROT|nr:hypothetical protein [Nitrosomonas marina]SEN44326.1 hypothetical protein SAMN05216325_11868 [Nitrosomonas marina]